MPKKIEGFMDNTFVDQIMSKNVLTVDKSTSIQEAALNMSKLKVGCVIVTEDTKPKGIVTVPPFDMPDPPEDVVSEEPNVNFLYIFLMVIWLFFLIRILFQLKKGNFKITNKY